MLAVLPFNELVNVVIWLVRALSALARAVASVWIAAAFAPVLAVSVVIWLVNAVSAVVRAVV